MQFIDSLLGSRNTVSAAAAVPPLPVVTDAPARRVRAKRGDRRASTCTAASAAPRAAPTEADDSRRGSPFQTLLTAAVLATTAAPMSLCDGASMTGASMTGVLSRSHHRSAASSTSTSSMPAVAVGDDDDNDAAVFDIFAALEAEDASLSRGPSLADSVVQRVSQPRVPVWGNGSQASTTTTTTAATSSARAAAAPRPCDALTRIAAATTTDDNFADLAVPERVVAQLREARIERPTAAMRALVAAVVGARAAHQDCLVETPCGSARAAAIALAALMHQADAAPRSRATDVMVVCANRYGAVEMHAKLTLFAEATAYAGSVALLTDSTGVDVRRFTGKKPSAGLVVGTMEALAAQLRRGIVRVEGLSLVVLDDVEALLATTPQCDALADMTTRWHRAGAEPTVAAVGSRMNDDVLDALVARFAPRNANRVTVVPALATDAGSDVHGLVQHFYTCYGETHTHIATDITRIVAAAASVPIACGTAARRAAPVVVFADSVATLDRLASRCNGLGCEGQVLHAGLAPQAADAVFRAYLRGRVQLLFTTDDFAAQIDGAEWPVVVVNFDAPSDDGGYARRLVHSGRAAVGVTLLRPNEALSAAHLAHFDSVVGDRIAPLPTDYGADALARVERARCAALQRR